MFKRIINLTLTIFLSLCIATVDAATPEYGADEAVLAYAELYTFGTSEHVAATGLPEEYAEEIKKNMLLYLMSPFQNYPLNKENFETVQSKLLEKLHELIKISARLKVDDAEKPVVEITTNHFDQKAINKLKVQDSDFMTLDVMTQMSEPQVLIADSKFQGMALKSILNIIDNLPVAEPQISDVTCKLIEYEGNFYWMPEDIKALSKFVDPVFKIKPTDPKKINEFIMQLWGNPFPSKDENSTEG